MFKGFDFTDFWTEDEVHDWDDYMESTPSDELIAELEEELGYKLPKSYIWLMKRHNGGEPRILHFQQRNLPAGLMIILLFREFMVSVEKKIALFVVILEQNSWKKNGGIQI